MSPAHTRLGSATIGLGVGEQHARALVATGRCDLRWVCDLDRAKSSRVAGDLGARVADKLEDVLADPAVDLVTLATYDDVHAEQALSALAAGKHLFVEKPLCRSHDELDAIRRGWAERPLLHLASNLVLRAAPLYRWLREAIAGGELGEVYAFDGDYLYGRLEKITDGWRRDVANYAVMQGGGVHLVDLLLWATGQRPSSVSACGNRIATKGTAFRSDDFVAATYRCESGLVARITANFGCVHPHQHVVRVFGTKGTFIHDDQGSRLQTSRASGSAATRLTLPATPATKGDLIPPFVDAILARGDPRDAARQEFDTMAACLAADEALRTGAQTEIEYR